MTSNGKESAGNAKRSTSNRRDRQVMEKGRKVMVKCEKVRMTHATISNAMVRSQVLTFCVCTRELDHSSHYY